MKKDTSVCELGALLPRNFPDRYHHSRLFSALCYAQPSSQYDRAPGHRKQDEHWVLALRFSGFSLFNTVLYLM